MQVCESYMINRPELQQEHQNFDEEDLYVSVP